MYRNKSDGTIYTICYEEPIYCYTYDYLGNQSVVICYSNPVTKVLIGIMTHYISTIIMSNHNENCYFN